MERYGMGWDGHGRDIVLGCQVIHFFKLVVKFALFYIVGKNSIERKNEGGYCCEPICIEKKKDLVIFCALTS
jgi:hypothetical protein